MRVFLNTWNKEAEELLSVSTAFVRIKNHIEELRLTKRSLIVPNMRSEFDCVQRYREGSNIHYYQEFHWN